METCPGLDMEHGFLAKIKNVMTQERQYHMEENKMTHSRNTERRCKRPPLQLYAIPARRRGPTPEGNMEDDEASLHRFLLKCKETQDMEKKVKEEVVQKCASEGEGEASKKNEIQGCRRLLTQTEKQECEKPQVECSRQIGSSLNCAGVTTITALNSMTDNLREFPDHHELENDEVSSDGLLRVQEICPHEGDSLTTQARWTPGDSCLMTEAIKDPSFVSDHSLRRVAMALVSTSCQSEMSSFSARRICMAIIQREKQMTADDPQYRFIVAILDACRLHVRAYEDQTLPGLIPFINFVGLLYRSEDIHRTVGEDMASLLQDLLRVTLQRLRHLHEAQHLFSILHKTATCLKRDIPDKMADLFHLVRTVFITISTVDAVKDILLDIIEAMAGRWSGRTTQRTFVHNTWWD